MALVLPSLFCICSSTDISRAIELLDKLQRTGEVPPQKLQALQRVLQSEFCNAVREVSVPASHSCIQMKFKALCNLVAHDCFASFICIKVFVSDPSKSVS